MSDKNTPGSPGSKDQEPVNDPGQDKTKPEVILPPDQPKPPVEGQKDNPTQVPVGQESSSGHVRNPNPRANENLPDEAGDEDTKTDGPGSEITDGEAG